VIVGQGESLSARRPSSSQVSRRRLALGSPVLVAAVSWQPLALIVDTMMMWPNFAMGWLSQVALVACTAGGCVMITTVVSDTSRRPSPGASRLRSTGLRPFSPR